MFAFTRLTDRLTDRLSLPSYAALLARVGMEPRRSMTARLIPAIGCFAAGFAAGLGTGLLVAPAAGVETRERIADRIRSTAADMRGTMDRAVERARIRVRRNGDGSEVASAEGSSRDDAANGRAAAQP